MSMKHRQDSAQSKAMMALEAVNERRMGNKLGAEDGARPTQISQWKRQLLEGLPQTILQASSEARSRRGSPAGRTVPGGRPPEDGAGVVEKSCPIQPWKRAENLALMRVTDEHDTRGPQRSFHTELHTRFS
jgi:hypothetical protein